MEQAWRKTQTDTEQTWNRPGTRPGSKDLINKALEQAKNRAGAGTNKERKRQRHKNKEPGVGPKNGSAGAQNRAWNKDQQRHRNRGMDQSLK
jgi:hypothetical protein